MCIYLWVNVSLIAFDGNQILTTYEKVWDDLAVKLPPIVTVTGPELTESRRPVWQTTLKAGLKGNTTYFYRNVLSSDFPETLLGLKGSIRVDAYSNLY